jgi:HEXXH motif-containing protein
MVIPHGLAPEQFDRLACGGGAPDDIEALRAAQVSRHLLLIGRLLGHWPGPASERDAIADALQRARDRSPEAFPRVVGAPLVGGWLAIVNRAMSRGLADRADFGHLAALAMVACAASGCPGEAEVPVRDGVVALPGLGLATVAGAGTARIVTAGGRLVVHAGGRTLRVPVGSVAEEPTWQAVRYLSGDSAGHRIRLALDDVDPYRHGHHAPPALRLPVAELDRWRHLFADAWRLLAERLPARAAEIAAGLRALVPLVHDGRSARSATIRHAFGVFGLTRPESAAEFAVTLVHEFQHSKLSALLHLVPLSDPADDRRYFAPWRVDPRPLAGLLQGVYAFVGVADTWRALRNADGLGEYAETQFAEARLQVHRGLMAVEDSGALTPTGERVAAQLRRVTDTLLAEPVAPATARAAAQALDETRRQWAARNDRPVD